ncbi:hypothetical protein [Actinacidiphila acidipaludis]|uniref:DUF3558 domain-containing protein n=1 Tax=Actinacidiphila acidipaludis TaxID=2873382 RepID=A0ABS7QJ03_9ACTN|nr:hypothetical protein [Streptomyces acidipaludis]MBY8882781.1 hypothetical protein [Streptomyces acidipaludis]
MISEPELTGGVAWAPAPAPPRDATGRTPAPRHVTGEVPPAGDLVAGSGPDPVPRRRPPRHWVWALGGAVAASAVWSAGVAAWDPARGTPDLRGYHMTAAPCAGHDLKPLFDATPGRAFSADPSDTLWGSALDSTECSAENLGRAHGGTPYAYSAALSIELHKKTDPRPEFDDRHRTALPSVSKVETVPGLGDEAYLMDVEPDTLQLDVLDGGAVISLAFSVHAAPTDVTPHPDGSARPTPQVPGQYRSQLVAAVRNVMADMRALPQPAVRRTP